MTAHLSVRRLLCQLTLVAAVATSVAAFDTPEHLTIRVWPTTSFEPTNLLVQVLVARHADNRSIRITVDSPNYYSTSEVQLNGESSPRLLVVQFRDVPAGAYALRGELFNDRGRVRGSARTSATVMGR